jgi:hypothetical protein
MPLWKPLAVLLLAAGLIYGFGVAAAFSFVRTEACSVPIRVFVAPGIGYGPGGCVVRPGPCGRLVRPWGLRLGLVRIGYFRHEE